MCVCRRTPAHLPGAGVLPEERPTVVHNEGRNVHRLAVVTGAQVEHGLEVAQVLVLGVLGGVGHQPQVTLQRVQFQVPEDDGLAGRYSRSAVLLDERELDGGCVDDDVSVGGGCSC